MTDELVQGLELTLLGMGVVFLFLSLLVVVVAGVSRVANRFAPEAPLEPESRLAGGAVVGLPEQDQRMVAVIAAAIRRYRHHHGS